MSKLQRASVQVWNWKLLCCSSAPALAVQLVPFRRYDARREPVKLVRLHARQSARQFRQAAAPPNAHLPPRKPPGPVKSVAMGALADEFDKLDKGDLLDRP